MGLASSLRLYSKDLHGDLRATVLDFVLFEHSKVPLANPYSKEMSRKEKYMKIPQSIRELIANAPLAHLTTLDSKGGPQVTVVWVGVENEEFVIGHLAVHQKIKNIRRDPRVALSVLGDKTNAQGLREYVVAYGNARVTEGGAVDLLQRLAPIYLGPSADFPSAAMRNIQGYVTRIIPARFSGIGPWAAQAAD